MNNNIGKIIEKSKLKRNTTLKIISLIFAIVFWVFVMDQVNPEITKEFTNVRIEIVGVEQIVNEGLVLMGNEEYFVDIVVEGRRNDLLSFDVNYLVVIADVRGYKKGLNTVPIEKRVLVDNVDIVDISKADIKVELDQIISIAKPIEVVMTGTILKDYEFGDIEKEKIEIVVEGPETLINRIESLHGEMNITDIQNDFSTVVSLIPIDYEGNQVIGIEMWENSVKCSISVEKLKNVTIIANFLGEITEGYQLVDIRLNPSSIVVRGISSEIDDMKSVLTSEIELSNITEAVKKELTLILPESIDTPYFEEFVIADIIIEKIETKEFIFDLNEIAYTNLNEDFEFVLLNRDDEITVTLKDIISKLELVNKNNIQLTIDFDGIEIGKHEIPIIISSEIGVKQIELSREMIEIEIKSK